MGGAYTALAADAAATPYYNPGTTILQEGSSFSGSVHVFNKYDTNIGAGSDVAGAPARLSKGYFHSLPSASGVILNYKTFAVGLSILVPDYDFYEGQIKTDANTIASLSYVDESLWVGGTYSTRLTPTDSVGFSLYYTSRSLSRSVNDRVTTGPTATTIVIEEKNLTSNNLVAILGYHRQFAEFWAVGVSYRPPSIMVAGEGTYFRSVTQTSPYNDAEANQGSINAVTKIPLRLAIGLAREEPKHYTISIDATFYTALDYKDYPDFDSGTDDLHYRKTANFAIGYEQYLRTWLSVRAGAYTNLAASGSPDPKSTYRQLDQLDQYGVSANVNIRAHEQTSFTFGGYYTGGSGLSSQLIGGSVKIIPKTQQVFTMLVGTGFHF